jgi:hypothetical protein
MRMPLQVIAAGIVAILMGYCATPAVAANTPQIEGEQLGNNVRVGTVVSLNSTYMVITCRHKGKMGQLELVVNALTVQRGAIAIGSPVTVHYRTQDHRNFATSIQLRKSLHQVESELSPH